LNKTKHFKNHLPTRLLKGSCGFTIGTSSLNKYKSALRILVPENCKNSETTLSLSSHQGKRTKKFMEK
jgi:hypothetical protein